LSERRSSQRAPLLLEVRWESLSGKHSARATDISLSGCYIESIGQVTVGEKIHIEIQLPSGSWMPLQGEVVYRQDHLAFGLRFIGLTDQEQEMLGYCQLEENGLVFGSK
jgi:hypothetical protein